MKINAVAIQMEFKLDYYISPESFERKVFNLMDEASRNVKLSENSIVVFPEDVGTFLIFVEDDVLRFKSLKETANFLIKKSFISLLIGRIRHKCGWVSAFILKKWRRMWRIYYNVFSRIAGSILLPKIEPKGDKTRIVSSRIYNTSYTFSPRGGIIGVQRKVHLIPLEKALEVTPAPLEEIRVFKTNVGKIGVAICYDCFFDDVLLALAKQGAELLIQPSANPEPWDDRLEREWPKGCWRAVQKYSQFKYGVNPMAVGKIFDLTFEGFTSIIAKCDETSNRTGYIARSRSKDSEEIVIAQLHL